MNLFRKHMKFDELVKHILEHNPTGNMHLVSADEKQIYVNFSSSCTANMTSSQFRNAQAYGLKITGWNNKYCQEFLEWYLGPTSFFKSLFDYLGDDFHVIRNNQKKIVGFLITNNKVNIYLVNSLMKGTRTCKEHHGILEFWYKYHVEKGYNPGLVWLLSHFMSIGGDPIRKSHCILMGQYWEQPIAIDRFYNPDHKDWDMTAYQMAANGSYGGVDDYLLTSKKNQARLSKLPRVKKGKDLVTFFISRYKKAKEQTKSYNTEDIVNFFENYEEAVKEMRV